MEVADLILADYATVGEKGKFTLVGAGFTEIQAVKLPIVHQLMFLFIRLKVTIKDKGKNHLEVRLIGEKGSMFKVEGQVDVKADHQQEENLQLVIKFDNLRFDTEGEYNFEVVINGELKQNQILRIKQQATPQPIGQ
jgi:hypothetical protein